MIVDRERAPGRALLLLPMAEGSGERRKATPSCTPERTAEAGGGKDPMEAEARTEIKLQVTEAWIPERVRHALSKSKTMDEYRSNRPFRFLHALVLGREGRAGGGSEAGM